MSLLQFRRIWRWKELLKGFMTSDEVEDLTQGKTVYGCPDCGGKARWMGFPATVAEWDMHLKTKASSQVRIRGVELALRTAIRTFEERATVLSNLAKKSRGTLALEANYKKRAFESSPPTVGTRLREQSPTSSKSPSFL